jgi:hypothetical protein
VVKLGVESVRLKSLGQYVKNNFVIFWVVQNFFSKNSGQFNYFAIGWFIIFYNGWFIDFVNGGLARFVILSDLSK